MADDDLYGVIFAKELRIHRLEALLRRATRYVGMVKYRPGIARYTKDDARDLLTEIEAVLATSQHRKDTGEQL